MKGMTDALKATLKILHNAFTLL